MDYYDYPKTFEDENSNTLEKYLLPGSIVFVFHP